jgi:hypothetical protein
LPKASDWIRYKGLTKLSDTAPELAFKEFAKRFGFDCFKPTEPIKVVDEDGEAWEFSPDFDCNLRASEPFYVQIDGPHHWTKRFRAKDDWQDGQLIKKGKKVLRIDSPLVEDERYWPALWKQIQRFAYDPEKRKHRIYA